MTQRTGRPRELDGARPYALYLDAPTVEALRREARARGCSISRLVRELVQVLVQVQEHPEELTHA